MRISKVIISLMIGYCGMAYGFMPASGIWTFDAEVNGLPGRGLRINVENEVLVLTYFGYRHDGTSLFYLAAGPIVNNTFSGRLQGYSGGPVIGSAYQSAAASDSPGNVTITFSSGLKGTITLPGEPAKAISNVAFGYPKNPDGLLGTFLFVYGSSTLISEYRTLTRKTGVSTSYGNGVVANAAGTFGCEFGIGDLTDTVACAEATGSSYDDIYSFKISGDRGTGVGTWTSSSYYYPLHVLRTATKTGAFTGLNEVAISGLRRQSAQSLSQLGTQQVPSETIQSNLKAQNISLGASIELSPDESELASNWGNQLRALISQQ